LVSRTREQLLDEFRRNKRNRTLEEAQHLLTLCGFRHRPGRKEGGGVWYRGSFTTTLPKPHGKRDRVLAPKYIARILTLIDMADAAEEGEDE
jgi:hypothetical protein